MNYKTKVVLVVKDIDTVIKMLEQLYCSLNDFSKKVNSPTIIAVFSTYVCFNLNHNPYIQSCLSIWLIANTSQYQVFVIIILILLYYNYTVLFTIITKFCNLLTNALKLKL